jgi:NhaP-type Na+/H+ or K+/H+ antiporter
VFGSSSISLVWLVIGSAVLGLVLGMLIGALLRHRTRRPR